MGLVGLLDVTLVCLLVFIRVERPVHKLGSVVAWAAAVGLGVTGIL